MVNVLVILLFEMKVVKFNPITEKSWNYDNFLHDKLL